jgi:NADPH-dependent 2,4-dienoyl-CoA reductase/sulfur reductase-like enzyme/rhodanese-related sulfurtransferase/two-component sensor histidine kinase
MKKRREEPADELLRLAAVIAHQLKSPVSSALTIIRTVLGGFVGELQPRQRELLRSADAKCLEALATARRLMAIHRITSGQAAAEAVDLVALCEAAGRRAAERARESGRELAVECRLERAVVRAERGALEEAVGALLENALRYTPALGRIRLRLEAVPGGRGRARLTVGDSGIGVPEAERDRLFQPFFRASNAREVSRSGTGLGLALVRAVVESAGGSVAAGRSDLGGAEFALELPASTRASVRLKAIGEASMSKPRKVVIIGGVAAGPKVASKVIRLEPDAEVTVVDKGRVMSYAGCGLPYYVSGVVRDQKELVSTPAGAVRDPVFFQKVKNVRVLESTEALELDRAGHRVRVRSLIDGREDWLDYDQLALCTGARAARPPLAGIELKGIFTLHGVEDAEGIKAALDEGRAKDVVIVGGGLIGVEMAEALVGKGCRVTVVEMLPQIMPILDWEMARLVEHHFEAQGVKVLTGTRVLEFRPGPGGAGRVGRVVTSGGELPVDMVILAMGVRPNADLARAAGLELGATGAIRVDEFLRTSDPDIYAAGDCVECTSVVTGEPVYVPLGSTANKQGRVAAVNICGGSERFPGVLGTTICKVFDFSVARTGLSEGLAREAGFAVETVLVPGPDRAHFMPQARMIMLKLVADRRSGRLLGLQAVGPGECAKRIDVAATAITAGMTADQVSKLDLAYAPPYAEAMDNIITACNVMKNKLEGRFTGITPVEVKARLDRGEGFTFLDVRGPAEVEGVRLPGAVNIPLGALRGRLNELDKGRPVVAFCQISLRGYEAALVLRHAGFRDVRVMDGGLAMWPYEKLGK